MGKQSNNIETSSHSHTHTHNRRNGHKIVKVVIPNTDKAVKNKNWLPRKERGEGEMAQH